MIQVLQEVTEWKNAEIRNGIYYVNDQTQLVAYKSASGNYKEFIKPIKGFSKSRRKFVVIDEIAEEGDDKIIYVTGSNGAKYSIIDGKCSCAGFKFRKKCKHIEGMD